MHEAKTHLSKYVKKVQEGEEVIICKNGKPVAQIIPFIDKKKTDRKRLFGIAKDLIVDMSRFNEPLTDEDFPGIGLPKAKKKKRPA